MAIEVPGFTGGQDPGFLGRLFSLFGEGGAFGVGGSPSVADLQPGGAGVSPQQAQNLAFLSNLSNFAAGLGGQGSVAESLNVGTQNRIGGIVEQQAANRTSEAGVVNGTQQTGLTKDIGPQVSNTTTDAVGLPGILQNTILEMILSGGLPGILGNTLGGQFSGLGDIGQLLAGQGQQQEQQRGVLPLPVVTQPSPVAPEVSQVQDTSGRRPQQPPLF